MHCVYLLTFTKRKALGLSPFKYIGSKSNYSLIKSAIYDKYNRKYYGSSSYQDYDKIVKDDDIVVEILFTSLDYAQTLEAEYNLQISYDVVASLDYFNLAYAQRSTFTNPNYSTYRHITNAKCVRLPRTHPMVLSGEYVGVTKGIKLSEEVKNKIGRSGEANPFYGKAHSDEAKRLIGNKNRSRIKSPEEIANWVEKVAKLPMTPEHKQKLSLKNKNTLMLKNTMTGESVKIPKNDRDKYDVSIWKNPAAISQRRETCIYCGVTSVAGNIKRWHNDNCKEKHNENC